VRGSSAATDQGALHVGTDAVQYAILGLLSARTNGVHAYQLKIDVVALYGDFRCLNYGQLYRTLDRLERAGLIECTEHAQTGRPARKVYDITSGGQHCPQEVLRARAVDCSHHHSGCPILRPRGRKRLPSVFA